MPTTSKTRSLDRAIDILELLAVRGPSPLHELHRASGLSKTTLRRLLATLTRRQFVRRGLADGVYRANISIPRRGDRTHQGSVARLINAATPLLLQINDSIRWPIDLHVHHQGRMQIVESTSTISPFGFSDPYRPELELNIFAAASGVCYLSTLADERVLKLIEALRDQELWSLSRYRISPQKLFQELAAVRNNGYARRLANQTDQSGFHAIAAPILAGKQGIGAVSVRWPRSYLPVAAFADHHAEQVIGLAKAISAEFG
ncbi:MAG: helix-turn-helix domain-containing protein [Xanthobacteraceae bacterium]